MKILIRSAITAAAVLLPLSAFADSSYPNRAVKMVVPFAPGGPADAIARTVGEKMTTLMGQPVVIDNRPGAGGVTGMKAVAKSPADGYTFGIGSAGALAISVSLQPDPTYDPRKDLKALSLAANVPELFVVNPNVPAKTLAEFIALAKAKPGSLTVASSGAGSMPHLAAELLQQYAGIKLVHVPYRGAAPAVTDLLGGQVDAMFMDIAVLLPHVQSGKIRALAIGSTKRSEMLPDLPTTVELGYPQVLADNWYGVIAPNDLPQPVQDKLHAALIETLNMPDVKAKLGLQGAVAEGTSPAAFADFLAKDIDKWAAVVKGANIKPE
ncbi:MFS transporter [Azorhizobium oxalatiphilum]|uniref:MFS transporter n=1 Tax=Azorhizobium oxalatiphilum TaxID=980631 RepID=A0A917BTS1_9HYPH|nr:tripartite tricarboxylate transporter substrate binding protein [Azorhizobium oxalatiphilum]GGF57111.1 MFS transporter [Azorhizobium oxalatiphilum]